MKRQIEHLELERLRAENRAATVWDVWRLLDQRKLDRQRRAKGFLPEEPICCPVLVRGEGKAAEAEGLLVSPRGFGWGVDVRTRRAAWEPLRGCGGAW